MLHFSVNAPKTVCFKMWTNSLPKKGIKVNKTENPKKSVMSEFMENLCDILQLGRSIV